MNDRTLAAARFEQADNAWQEELVRAYGAEAPTFRYLSGYNRGAEGSALRAAFDARTEAHNTWLAANNCGPARA